MRLLIGVIAHGFTRSEDISAFTSFMKHTQNRLRIALDDAQQGLGRTFGFPASLLLVLESPDADADHL